MGWHSVFYLPLDSDEIERLCGLAEKAVAIAERLGDTVLAIDALHVLALSALPKGDPGVSRKYVDRLFAFGRRFDCPSATHGGLMQLALRDLMQDAPEPAIAKVDEALSVSLLPLARDTLLFAKALALAMSDRALEAAELIEDLRPRLVRNGNAVHLIALGATPGLIEILNGNFAKGFRSIKEVQDWLNEIEVSIDIQAYTNLVLGEVYLNMVLGGERPSLSVIFRNLWFLLSTLPFAAGKAKHHFEFALRRAEEAGHTARFAWASMGLGLLAKAKKRRAEARAHLERAAELAESIEANSIAERSRAALAELG